MMQAWRMMLSMAWVLVDVPFNGFGLRYDGQGTFVSGNAPLSSAHFGEVEKNTNFGSEFSWGYRLLATLTYDNLIGAWSVTPRVGWAQDVTGNTPGPGGNFVEGRETLTLLHQVPGRGSAQPDPRPRLHRILREPVILRSEENPTHE